MKWLYLPKKIRFLQSYDLFAPLLTNAEIQLMQNYYHNSSSTDSFYDMDMSFHYDYHNLNILTSTIEQFSHEPYIRTIMCIILDKIYRMQEITISPNITLKNWVLEDRSFDGKFHRIKNHVMNNIMNQFMDV